jgi:hypothetical protein
MALLTVTCMDAEGVLLPNVEVVAYLSNNLYEPIEAFDDDGYIIRRATAISNNLGIATFDLIPNELIHTANTLYMIDVTGKVAPVLIHKGATSETLEQALALAPPDLAQPFGLDNLWDVDLTGLGPGMGLRYVSGAWIPAVWPSGGGGGGEKSWATLNTSTTLTVVDAAVRHLADAAGGPFTVTLPSAVGLMPCEFTIKRVNSGANLVTVTSVSGIDGSGTYTLRTQWEAVTLSTNNSQWMVI